MSSGGMFPLKDIKALKVFIGFFIKKLPDIKKNIALAGIISLFAGIFLAFLMEYVERIRKEG